MNKYQATFRHKTTKAEVRQDTLAFNASDASYQCCVNFSGRGYLLSEYEMVGLGPHPDEIQLPLLSMLRQEHK
jgi:hypothetical protein